MPWCPKCKTEYRKGIKLCVDCGSELVEEQPETREYSKLCTLEKEEVAIRLMKYLEYSKIDSHYNYEEAELGFVVYVLEDELKKAKRSFDAFYLVELEQLQKEEEASKAKKDSKVDSSTDDLELQEETSDSDSDFQTEVANDMEADQDSNDSWSNDSDSNDFESENEESADLSTTDDYDSVSEEERDMLYDKSNASNLIHGGGTYEKKSDKLKDLKSTVATFLLFGIAGIVVVVLNLIGIIDFIGGTLQYCILCALFIGFLFVGFNSLKQIKKVKKEMVAEEEQTKNITEWLNANITEETLKELSNDSLSKEANFLRIMDGIKNLVIKEFGKLDEAYLDYLTEDFYDRKFGEDSFDEDAFDDVDEV